MQVLLDVSCAVVAYFVAAVVTCKAMCGFLLQYCDSCVSGSSRIYDCNVAGSDLGYALAQHRSDESDDKEHSSVHTMTNVLCRWVL